jgi:hypothetical protein
MSYAVLMPQDDETNVYVSDIPDEVDRTYKLLEEGSLADSFDGPLTLAFSDHQPQGLQLTDYIDNEFSWLVISSAFRTLLKSADTPPVEFVNAQLINHKGRLASDAYWLAHFTAFVEGVDRKQSEYDDDLFEEGQIDSYERLVLRSDVKDEGPDIFRLRETPSLILVRQEFVERVETANLTGMWFRSTDDYMTLDPFL